MCCDLQQSTLCFAWLVRQYRQHRTSDTCRIEHIVNSLMVDPINGCADINMHGSCLLLTLQYTLLCIGHAQKCITGTQTFPISKLGGWKHTSTSLRSTNRPRRRDAKPSNTLDNVYWFYGNRSVEEDRGPFVIGVTSACLQQTGKLPRRTRRWNTTIIHLTIMFRMIFPSPPHVDIPHPSPCWYSLRSLAS